MPDSPSGRNQAAIEAAREAELRLGIDSASLPWVERTVRLKVQQRYCVNCWKPFTPRIVTSGGSNRGRATRFVVSAATTCGPTCLRELRSERIAELHDRIKQSEPERYAQWMARDYSAMGKARHSS